MKDCEKLKTKKNSFVLNTSSNLGPIKSPGRYAPQHTINPPTIETITKSVFVGGMSKALLQAKDTSDTSS